MNQLFAQTRTGLILTPLPSSQRKKEEKVPHFPPPLSLCEFGDNGSNSASSGGFTHFLVHLRSLPTIYSSPSKPHFRSPPPAAPCDPTTSNS